MLPYIRVLFSTLILSIISFSTAALASPVAGEVVPLEPAWEKIDGQWNFNNSNKSERQILVHITSYRINTQSKNLLIKDLVKLPFVMIIESKDMESKNK
tara:strand:- start:1702 stop:1998 length:297 start_codon:yes stop_codon:yes gene_type:complete